MTDEENKEKYELKFTNRFKKHLKLVDTGTHSDLFEK